MGTFNNPTKITDGVSQERFQFWECVIYGSLAIVLLWPLLGYPQAGPGAAPMGMAIGAQCASDIAKFCPNVRRGPPLNAADQSSTMMSCLVEHKEKLSANCQAALQAKKEWRNTRSPCSQEIERYCADEDFGQMRMFQCLNKQNKKDFSPACISHLEQRLKEGPQSMGRGRRGGGRLPTGP